MFLPLDDLLDRTRDALLSGDLAALTKLAPQLAAQAESLQPLATDVAHRLHQKAERNARLLQSAARGMRAAQDRLVQITTAPSLATYDSQGRKATLAETSAPALRRF
jgi:hypothetical protein